jgi:hypothetical protein
MYDHLVNVANELSPSSLFGRSIDSRQMTQSGSLAVAPPSRSTGGRTGW